MTLTKETSLVVEDPAAFSKGLQDIIAAESAICRIDGKGSKLYFRGYDIHDLAENSNFEETSYLLIFGAMPKAAELATFRSQLAAQRTLPVPVLEAMRRFPRKADPMALLRTAVSVLALEDAEADDKSREANVRKTLRLIARTPAIVAAIDRLRKGLEPVAPRTDAQVGIAADFLRMLKGAEATDVEVRMLDKYFVLLAEHDLNASTFAACVTASTLSDIYSAMVSAIGTLKGDLHGSANTRTMENILEIGDVSRVEAFVDKALAEKKKIMGFGHRVYKGPDPRAFDLHAMARTLAENNREQSKWYAISEKLEKVVMERKQLNCNVDFYSASVLYTIGIPVDLFTPMFAISRMSGWCAHVLEQYADNRLLRPVSRYTGPEGLRYVPIQQR